VSDSAHSNTADVVVIGGGVLGCSVAYHLRLVGAGRVLLLERDQELATQTTSAGAGFVALWTAAAEECEPELGLERYALEFYRALGRKHAIDLKSVGMIWLATIPAGAAGLERAHARARQRVSSDEVALLAPEQLRALVPIIASERITAALHWPTAIRVSAPLATKAIGRELIELGVNVRTGTLVTGIEQSEGHVTAVQTSQGVIATRTIVNAAGAWLPEIARMAGTHIPLLPLQASRFVTKPLAELPADMPLLMFTDYHGLYLREEQGGLLIGSEEIVAHPPSLMRALSRGLRFTRADSANVPADVHGLPDTTHRYHLTLARELATAVPALGSCVVKEVRNGIPTRTPDLRHVLGQAPGVGGCYFLGADCEIGVTHGPGLGRGLAELVVQGRTSADLSAYRPDRW